MYVILIYQFRSIFIDGSSGQVSYAIRQILQESELTKVKTAYCTLDEFCLGYGLVEWGVTSNTTWRDVLTLNTSDLLTSSLSTYYCIYRSRSIFINKSSALISA